MACLRADGESTIGLVDNFDFDTENMFDTPAAQSLDILPSESAGDLLAIVSIPCDKTVVQVVCWFPQNLLFLLRLSVRNFDFPI